MNFKTLFGIKRFDYFVISTTNRCNLNCEYCITLCHRPLNPDSQYEILRSHYEISIEEVEQFCERFKGVGEEDYIRLTGGEPTLIPEDRFTEIVEVLHQHGRRIWMISNGYAILKLPEQTLRKIKNVTLDDHTVNTAHLKKCAPYLRRLGVAVKTMKVPVHYDLIKAVNSVENRMRPCALYMATPTLYKSTVYPCCSTLFIEMYSDEHRKASPVTAELRRCGWTLDNPRLPEALAAWRKNGVPSTMNLCRHHCYRHTFKSMPHAAITQKPHDVIHA